MIDVELLTESFYFQCLLQKYINEKNKVDLWLMLIESEIHAYHNYLTSYN